MNSRLCPLRASATTLLPKYQTIVHLYLRGILVKLQKITKLYYIWLIRKVNLFFGELNEIQYFKVDANIINSGH